MCEHHQIESSCCRVAVGETVVIPPGTEMTIPGKYVHPIGVTGSGVLEISAKFAERTNVSLGKTLVDMERKLNPTAKPQTVHKDTTVAWCEPVAEVFDTEDELLTVASCQKPDAYVCQARNAGAEVPERLAESEFQASWQ